MALNYQLNPTDYTWKNALLWGNCKGHFELASKGKANGRVVHVLIGIAQAIPLLGQIGSIMEKLIVDSRSKPATKPIPKGTKGSVTRGRVVSPTTTPSTPLAPAKQGKLSVDFNNKVLNLQCSDHSIMTFQTPDGPIVSSNVMCSGEDHDPMNCNAFKINPLDEKGRNERFKNMVDQIKESADAALQGGGQPIIALQEFPRRNSTGAQEFTKLIKANFPTYQIVFGEKEANSHDQSQLCFLVPQGLTVTKHKSPDSRAQIIQIGSVAYVNVHPQSPSSKDDFQNGLVAKCKQLVDSGACSTVSLVGDWNRRRNNLRDCWENPNLSSYTVQIASPSQGCHHSPKGLNRNPIDHLVRFAKQ